MYIVYNSVHWLCLFLSNHAQLIALVSKKLSSLYRINIGVRQSSTLVPLFFPIYINDFEKCLSCLNAFPLADNNTLYKQIELSINNEYGLS